MVVGSIPFCSRNLLWTKGWSILALEFFGSVAHGHSLLLNVFSICEQDFAGLVGVFSYVRIVFVGCALICRLPRRLRGELSYVRGLLEFSNIFPPGQAGTCRDLKCVERVPVHYAWSNQVRNCNFVPAFSRWSLNVYFSRHVLCLLVSVGVSM